MLFGLVEDRSELVDLRFSRASVMTTKSQDRFSERRCTMMAVVIICTFILCNVIASANGFIAIILQTDGKYVWQRLLVFFGNFLTCVNSASNIAIYCIFGSRFRRMCARILCRCCIDKQQQYNSLLFNGGSKLVSGDLSAFKDTMAMRRLRHAKCRGGSYHGRTARTSATGVPSERLSDIWCEQASARSDQTELSRSDRHSDKFLSTFRRQLAPEDHNPLHVSNNFLNCPRQLWFSTKFRVLHVFGLGITVHFLLLLVGLGFFGASEFYP